MSRGVRHMVMFTWNDDVDDATIAEISTALAEMAAQVPTITSFQFGPDLGVNDGNAHFAVTATFADEAGYLTYRDHPAHQDFIARQLSGRIAGRTAMQILID